MELKVYYLGISELHSRYYIWNPLRGVESLERGVLWWVGGRIHYMELKDLLVELLFWSHGCQNPLRGVEGVTRQTETDICGMNGGPLHGVGKEMVWG